MTELAGTDAEIFITGTARDAWSTPFWKVEGVGENRRCAFGLREGAGPEEAFERLRELKLEHPEYTRWAVLKFEKFIHITIEEEAM